MHLDGCCAVKLKRARHSNGLKTSFVSIFMIALIPEIGAASNARHCIARSETSKATSTIAAS